MNNIALIGCGQLGSRHLQSLANLNLGATIYVHDVSEDSLRIAKSRYDEIESASSIDCVYTSDLADLPNQLDLVIIASNSLQRLGLIQAVTAGRNIRYMILEKVLFPRLEDYGIAQTLLLQRGIRCWVNCNKASNNTFFSAMNAQFDSKSPVHIRVEGREWGLGCNAIHFVELLSFLIGQAAQKIDSSDLSPVIHESKRTGYIEFHGKLKISSGSHKLELNSIENGPAPLVLVLDSAIMRAELSFGERLTGKVERRDNDWVAEHIDTVIKRQSELTSVLVEDILLREKCVLPEYEKSKINHLLLLESLIEHLDRFRYPHRVGECLIT